VLVGVGGGTVGEGVSVAVLMVGGASGEGETGGVLRGWEGGETFFGAHETRSRIRERKTEKMIFFIVFS
jgi:hypothetical protein